MKNTLRTCLVMVLCAMMLSAPVISYPEEIPTVSALINSASGILPPEKNFVIDTLNEKLGVNLQFYVCANHDDYVNRLATLKASQNLPDIIHTNRAELKEMIENDVVLPLDDLLAEYGQDLLADKDDTFSSFTFDGKIYGIPNTSSEWSQNVMMGIRKDWLDNLSLEVPKTLDDFYNVMKAFTYDDPDGNGVKDTIGLGIALTSGSTWGYGIAEAFGISRRYQNLVDGKVTPWLLHPNYLEMIKYYQKLYQEGLMEPDFATAPWINVAEALWAGKYGAIAFGPIGTSNNWMSRYAEPKPEWVYVMLEGPYGDSGFDIQHPGLGGCVAVNANAKYPEAVMRVLNYAVTEEGQDLLILGLKGKHFKDNDDGSISYLPPYDADITLQRNEGGYAYCGLMGSMKHCATMKTLNDVTREALIFGMSKAVDSLVLYDTPEIGLEVGGLLDDITKEAFASLIVTSGDIEAEYQSYVDKYLRSGGAEWVEQATEIYEAQTK
ncbi:MAG: extracellular solute-binding protein [Christensenellales bacterium]|jgi:putative aldouronate transport system substrate-binding protein